MNGETLLAFFTSTLLPVVYLLTPLFLALFWMLKYALKINYDYYHAFRKEIDQQLAEQDSRESRDNDGSEMAHREILQQLHTLLARTIPRLPKRPLWMPQSKVATESASSLEQQQKVINLLVDQLEQATFLTHPDFRNLAQEILHFDRHFSRLFNLIPIDSLTRWLMAIPKFLLWLSLVWAMASLALMVPSAGHAELALLKTNEDLLYWVSTRLQEITLVLLPNLVLVFILKLHLLIFSPTLLRERIVFEVSRALEIIWRHTPHHNVHPEILSQLVPQLLSEVRTLQLKINQLNKGGELLPHTPPLKKVS